MQHFTCQDGEMYYIGDVSSKCAYTSSGSVHAFELQVWDNSYFYNFLCEIEQGFSTLRRLVVEDQEKRKRIVATVNFTLH